MRYSLQLFSALLLVPAMTLQGVYSVTLEKLHNTGNIKNNVLNIQVTTTLENDGFMYANEGMTIKCNTLKGGGTIKSPRITIIAREFDYYGKIHSCQECNIITYGSVNRDAFNYSCNGTLNILPALYISRNFEAYFPKDLNTVCDNNLTPLMAAVVDGDLDAVARLLHAHADPEVKNKKGATALTIAVEKGQLDTVRVLVERGGAVVNNPDHKNCPFRMALHGNHFAIAEYLVSKGADINSPDVNGQTPLKLAVAKGQVNLAKKLLDKGAKVNEVDNNGATPLIEAARKGDLEMVRVLLDHGANKAIQDNSGLTAGDYALKNNHNDVAVLVLPPQEEPVQSVPLVDVIVETLEQPLEAMTTHPVTVETSSESKPSEQKPHLSYGKPAPKASSEDAIVDGLIITALVAVPAALAYWYWSK